MFYYRNNTTSLGYCQALSHIAPKWNQTKRKQSCFLLAFQAASSVAFSITPSHRLGVKGGAQNTDDSLLQQALDKGYLPVALDGGVQKLQANLNPPVYPFIILQKGIPITAEEINITGCNQTVILPSFDVRKALTFCDNVISLNPNEAGLIAYAYSMGMLDGRILDVDDLFEASTAASTTAPVVTPALEPAVPTLNTTRLPGSCCG